MNRTKVMDIIGALLRFIGSYSTTIITFGVPIYICWDWFKNGMDKYINMGTEFYLLLTEHTPLIAMLAVIFILFAVIFYLLVYRLIFPDYIRVIKEHDPDADLPARYVPSYDGRIYWIDNYGLSALWARLSGHKLGDAKTREVRIYYNMRGMLNIFVPTRSMSIQEGMTAAQIERENPWKIRIYEHGRSIVTDVNKLKTIPGSMEQVNIDLKTSSGYLKNSMIQHVSDVKTASQADVGVIKGQIAESTYTLPDELIQEIINNDKEQKERETRL